VRRVLLLPLLAALPAAACPPVPPDGRSIVGEGVTAAWRVADASAIEVARHFALLVRVCPAEAQLVAVDATMPAHRHGMNYRPSLQPLGDGRWRVEGLLFHMSGTWELRLDLRAAGRTQVLRQAIELP
jgi:hypothetical protein